MSTQPIQISLDADLVHQLYPFLIVLDRDLRLVQLGRGLSKISTDAAIGMPLLDAFTIHRPRLKASFEALRQASRATFYLDSKSTQIRLRGQVIHDRHSDCLIFLGSPWFTDIAELQRTKLELLDFTVHDPIMDYLYMVQAKTLALQDAQRLSETLKNQKEVLERTNKDLERANAAKSQFLANTSHELRTPLNGIIGMTTLLGRTPLDSQQRHYGETILKSAKALLTVVNDILDFSKIEAGKLSLEVAEFDVHQLVHNILDVFAVAAHQKGLELVCVIDDKIPKALQGDSSRLRQILDNLIGNALKFTQQGEILVRTEIVGQDDERMMLRFTIKDTGIGIDPQDQERLFKAFSQVDNSMSRNFGGTGLGLVICKQLAGLMNGEVGVESERGKGSQFWFTAWMHKVPSEVKEEPPPEFLSTVRVLVVDDNATNRQYLQTMMKHWGAHAEVADSGLRALELLRSGGSSGKPFELAIVDMRMPGMTGLDLAHILAGDPSFENLRLVLLGGSDFDPTTNLSKARVHAVVSKPVRPSQLLDCLSRLMVSFAQRPAGSVIITQKLALNSEAVKKAVHPQAAPPPPRPAPSTITPSEGQPRLLVVDDNPINLEVASLMLNQLGYRVDMATNGQLAIEALEKASFDAVLMDLQMPICDGYQATAEIRRREGTERHTPVIAMTAHAMPSDRKRAIDAGMDDYVSKPIDPDLLTKVVHKWAPIVVKTEAPRQSSRSARHRDSSDAIDLSALEELRRYKKPGVSDYAAHVTGLFLNDLGPRIKAIRDAPHDQMELARNAHSLKGTSGLVGAKRLSQLCARLEDAARKGEETHDLVQQFLTECERVRSALEGQRATPIPSAPVTLSAEEFFAKLHAELAAHPALHHQFLQRFRSEILNLKQLHNFAIQHYMYSRHFNRNLGAIISNIPDENVRNTLVLNMYEEIGEPLRIFNRVHRDLLRVGLVTLDDIREAYAQIAQEKSDAEVSDMLVRMGRVEAPQVQAFIESGLEEAKARSHPALFRRFLLALDVTSEVVINTEPIPETAQFIEEYQNICRYGSWHEALGAMGVATESVVPKLYSPILDGIAKSRIMSPDDYIFWTLHVNCDDGHGANIIRSLLPYAATAENQNRIARGARRALDARNAWFDGLLRLVFGNKESGKDNNRDSSLGFGKTA